MWSIACAKSCSQSKLCTGLGNDLDADELEQMTYLTVVDMHLRQLLFDLIEPLGCVIAKVCPQRLTLEDIPFTVMPDDQSIVFRHLLQLTVNIYETNLIL
jgi:hypothetical protein